MFGFVFRAIGLFLLALALVLAVLDITRSITASAIVITPLAETWAAVGAASLLQFKVFVEGNVHALAWDPVMLFFLKLPSWLLVWLISMLCMWLGEKRQTRLGRFASH